MEKILETLIDDISIYLQTKNTKRQAISKYGCYNNIFTENLEIYKDFIDKYNLGHLSFRYEPREGECFDGLYFIKFAPSQFEGDIEICTDNITFAMTHLRLILENHIKYFTENNND